MACEHRNYLFSRIYFIFMQCLKLILTPEGIQHFRNSKSFINRKNNFVSNLFQKMLFELGDKLNNLLSGNLWHFLISVDCLVLKQTAAAADILKTHFVLKAFSQHFSSGQELPMQEEFIFLLLSNCQGQTGYSEVYYLETQGLGLLLI